MFTTRDFDKTKALRILQAALRAHRAHKLGHFDVTRRIAKARALSAYSGGPNYVNGRIY